MASVKKTLLRKLIVAGVGLAVAVVTGDISNLFDGMPDDSFAGTFDGAFDGADLDSGLGGPGSSGTSDPHFGYEGFYPQGVDHNGNTVIESGAGSPVLQSTGQPVDPNDVTWRK